MIKPQGKQFLKFDQSKCLSLLFLFHCKELGFCYCASLPGLPFRLQFYMNGHKLLASKLQRKKSLTACTNNAFLEISDMEAGPKAPDRINPEKTSISSGCFRKTLLSSPLKHSVQYTWTVRQNSLYQLSRL